MNAPTNIQTIMGPDGKPAFVVMPYGEYVRSFTTRSHAERDDLIPHEVVGKNILEDMPMVRAWREYLNMTQSEVAQRAGMSQAALAQMESGEHKMRKATKEKIATALGISVKQLGA